MCLLRYKYLSDKKKDDDDDEEEEVGMFQAENFLPLNMLNYSIEKKNLSHSAQCLDSLERKQITVVVVVED